MAPTATLPDTVLPSVREFLDRDQHLLIGGERQPAGDGRTFPTLDPGTGGVLAQVAHAGAADVDRAVAAARAAFQEDSPWRRASPAERGRIIARLPDAVEAHAEELAQLESLDTGKPVGFAPGVDVASTVEHLGYFAGRPSKIDGAVIPVSQPPTLSSPRREPVVVG